MKRIDFSNLRKGDILLTTQVHPTSKAIRATTKSDISHAMLYVAEGSVMDSTGEGVHARNLQREIFEDSCAIYVYRAKAAIDAESMDRIVAYVRSETGAPYATWDAMRSPLKPNRKGNADQFCSRLVARAYASAGFALTDNPDFTTPADLQRSPRLERIEAVVLPVTAQEMVELEDDDSVEGMRKVTNDLLTRVRAISPAIRVLNDIPPFLLSNPSFDAAIAEAHRASGFLDYWKVEVARHPYRYDPVAMVQFYQATSQKAGLLEYCRATLKDDAANVFAHWRVNLDACAALLKIKPLETFQLNHDLYLTLCFNHDRRVKTAKILLNTYGDRSTT
jgi:hypothetical protein